MHIKTERVSPFTFKFEYGIKDFQIDKDKTYKSIKDILYKSQILKTKSNVDTIKEELFKTDIDGWCERMSYNINGEVYTPKIFAQKLIPESLFNNIVIRYSDKINSTFNLSKVDSYIGERLLKVLYSEDYIDSDSEELRKGMKLLSNEDRFKKYPEFKKNLKEMKPQHIESFIDYVFHFKRIPTPEMMNKIFDPLMKIGSNIMSQITQMKKEGGKEMNNVYVSKNPMEMLTMSPSGNFKSCQCLTEFDGASTVSSLNANMISSTYGDHNNDFIIYTTKNTDKGLEKSARVSLNYDEETKKLNTFEKGKIYGSTLGHMNILKKFMENNIKDINMNEDMENTFSKHFTDEIYKNMSSNIFLNERDIINGFLKELDIDLKNNNKESFDKTIKKIELFDKEFTNKKNNNKYISEKVSELADVFKNKLENVLKTTNKSMLYNSDIHKLFLYGSIFDPTIAGAKIYNNISSMLYNINSIVSGSDNI